MKRLFFSLVLLSVSFAAQCQIQFGLKAGVSSTDLTNMDMYLDRDGSNNIAVAFEDAAYGIHFGFYTRVSLLGIYIEPSFLLNSTKLSYNLREEIFDTGVVESVASETFETLDIPVMVGYKLGFLRLQMGPVAHLQLNSTSELIDLNGYKEKIKEATYGYQIGAGLDIFKVRLDLNYEGGISSYADHINVGGEAYSLSDNPSRIVATLGYKF